MFSTKNNRLLSNSTRVSNELGAGRPQSARLALQVMIIMALSEGAAIAIATVSVRHVWGKLYSNENEVITYVAKMMPLLALSDFLDGFQCVLSGPKLLSATLLNLMFSRLWLEITQFKFLASFSFQNSRSC